MNYIYKYDSPLGGITLASDGVSLKGLWFDGQKHFAETLLPEHTEKSLPVFRQTMIWLDIYFDGKAPCFTPKLDLCGTPFRKAVWDILMTIPYGQIITYGEIADRLSKVQGMEKVSAQAVGGAVGHNPVSVIVPCHRVVGANGSLTGYAGGTDRKLALLTLEKADISGLK